MNTDIAVNEIRELSLNELDQVTGGCMSPQSRDMSGAGTAAAGVVGAGVAMGLLVGAAGLAVFCTGLLVGEALMSMK
jgi:hypothetical protein